MTDDSFDGEADDIDGQVTSETIITGDQARLPALMRWAKTAAEVRGYPHGVSLLGGRRTMFQPDGTVKIGPELKLPTEERAA